MGATWVTFKAWVGWCTEPRVHPLTARRHHVDRVKHIRDPQPASGRHVSPATIARRLSCLSKFDDYGMREVELAWTPPNWTDCSPPPNSTHRAPPRCYPLLVCNGLRIEEAWPATRPR